MSEKMYLITEQAMGELLILLSRAHKSGSRGDDVRVCEFTSEAIAYLGRLPTVKSNGGKE